MYLWLTQSNTKKLALYNMDRVDSVTDDGTDGPGATLWFSDASTVKVQESLADVGDLLGRPRPTHQQDIWLGLEAASRAFKEVRRRTLPNLGASNPM